MTDPISLSTILAAIGGAVATAYGTYKTMKSKEDERVTTKAKALAEEEAAWRREILEEADKLHDRIDKMQEQIDRLLLERSQSLEEINALRRKVSEHEYTIETLKRNQNDLTRSS